WVKTMVQRVPISREIASEIRKKEAVTPCDAKKMIPSVARSSPNRREKWYARMLCPMNPPPNESTANRDDNLTTVRRPELESTELRAALLGSDSTLSDREK